MNCRMDKCRWLNQGKTVCAYVRVRICASDFSLGYPRVDVCRFNIYHYKIIGVIRYHHQANHTHYVELSHRIFEQHSIHISYLRLYLTETCVQAVMHCKQSLWWRHNERDGVSNHQLRDCLLKRLFRRRSNKTSKLRVTGLFEGNSPVTGEFPAQMASNAENVSIWWRHSDWL